MMISLKARSFRRLLVLALCAACLLLGACESRTDKVDGGGVLLSINDFDGLPVQVSINQAEAIGLVQIDEVTIESIAKDPAGGTSDLMNVEMESYEITFSRADSGSRLPPPLVRRIFGVVPVNGTETYENLPILTLEQLERAPLADLLVVNGGLDTETGAETILLNLSMRFFGRTLSGDRVDTVPAQFTLEFVR